MLIENDEKPPFNVSDQKVASHPSKVAKKRCRSCKSSIPIDAPVCRFCGRHQRWYLNYLQHAGLLITLGMMAIAYQQLGEARKIRSTESQTLERARGAEKNVIAVSKDVLAIKTEVEQHQESIRVTEGKAKQALSEIQAIQKISGQAKTQAETATKLLVRAETSVKELRTMADFNLLVLKATNDDREAFDRLRKIGPSERPLYQLAHQTVQEIAYDIKLSWNIISEPSLQYAFDWSKTDYDFLLKMYHTVPPLYRSGFVSKLWSQQHFSKQKRLDFLYQVIKTDTSIKALNRACMFMNQEAQINRNILAADEYLRWYEANRTKYSEPK
jgi:hypothetical protein